MIRDLLCLIKKKPEVKPSTEPINHIVCPDLERRSSYILKEMRPEISFRIFTSLVRGKCRDCNHPEAFLCESIGCEDCTLSCPCRVCMKSRAQGLCITMLSPEEVRQAYTLQTTPIFWISGCGPESISPAGLEVIADIIKTFLRKSKSPVVLLDGIEYLVITNGFIPVLKFLRDIQEWVVLHDAIFLVPVNPKALEEKELALIERNMKELRVPQTVLLGEPSEILAIGR